MMPIDLPVAEYRFHFTAKTPVQLPHYSGSAWRGLFGHALKRTVCVTHEKDCKQCLLWRNCVYSYIFETPPPADTEIMRRYNAAPHPFVIIPPPRGAVNFGTGAALQLQMLLIGRANQHLPYLIHAMQQAGHQGIGSGRGQFSLQQLQQRTTPSGWQTIYEPDGQLQNLPPQQIAIPDLPEGQIQLEFHTPFRTVHQGKLVKADEFRFSHLLGPLMRRISLLQYFHTDKPLQLDFKALTQQAETVQLSQNHLTWSDWQRYSSRQQQAVKMGGLTGSIVLQSQAVTDFWPMLCVGSVLHAGKGTVMGLGRYHLQPTLGNEDNAEVKSATEEKV